MPKRIAVVLASLAAVPAPAQPIPPMTDEQLRAFMPAGEALEKRADGDLNADGVPDVAFISYGQDNRALHVLRGVKGEFDLDYAEVGKRELDAYPQGAAELSIVKGVLKMVDLTGGTTATQATYRYRYDPVAKKLRLIGLDATNYSRTYAHDGYEISWNLLTGALIMRDMKLNKKGGDAAYDPIVEKRGKRLSKPVYLAQTPDPDELMGSLRK